MSVEHRRSPYGIRREFIQASKSSELDVQVGTHIWSCGSKHVVG